MAYLKPPWFTVKVFNKIAMATGISGGNRGVTARFTATEIPIDHRPPILQAYRAKAGKTVDGYFAKLPDPADHPVFSLTPA